MGYKGKVIMAEFSDVRFDARVLKEAKALAQNGFRVILHMYDASAMKKNITIRDNIEYHVYGFKQRYNNQGLAGVLKKYLQAAKILVVINLWILVHHAGIYHAHNLKFLFFTYLSSVIHHGKLVYDAHEIHSELDESGKFIGKTKDKFHLYFEKMILNRCHLFIQASEERAVFVAQKYNIEKPMVINNYVPYFKANKSDEKIRKELKLSQDYPIMFYSGGIYLGGGRRLDNVIKAIRSIDKLYFVIIGFMNQSVGVELNSMLSEYGLQERVFILPPYPNNVLLEFAASADFGVIPLAGDSVNTQLSALNKVSEYLMCGLPLVCSDYPNLKNLVYNKIVGQIGETFNVHNIDSIEKAIRKMIFKNHYLEYTGRTLELASKHYNWEHEEKKLIEWYTNLCCE